MLKECDEWNEKCTQFWGKKFDWTNWFFSFEFFCFSFARISFFIQKFSSVKFMSIILQHDSLNFFPFSVPPPSTFHVTESLSLFLRTSPNEVKQLCVRLFPYKLNINLSYVVKSLPKQSHLFRWNVKWFKVAACSRMLGEKEGKRAWNRITLTELHCVNVANSQFVCETVSRPFHGMFRKNDFDFWNLCAWWFWHSFVSPNNLE